MKERNYLNFDIYISQMSGTTDYRVEVTDSPAGRAATTTGQPFSNSKLSEFMQTLVAMHPSATNMAHPDMEIVKKFGWDFFNKVIAGDVLTCFKNSLAVASYQKAQLRIRLRLSGHSELSYLPWEFLYLPQAEFYLQLVRNIEMVRYLELLAEQDLIGAQLPLRILVVSANPYDKQSSQIAERWQYLNNALSELEALGLAVIDRIEHVTTAALQQRLESLQPHVLHYIGWGETQPGMRDGMLLFENPLGNSERISGLRLGDMLKFHRSVGIVTLDACDSLRTSYLNPYTGSAESLVQSGTPAVIAVQLEMSSPAMATFAQTFYRAIAEGLHIEAAVDEARTQVFERGSDIEWGTPALYSRVRNGLVFQFDKESSERQKLLQTTPVYQEALEAMKASHWATAIGKLESILNRFPEYSDAADRLHEARKAQANATFETGLRHQKNGDWQEAKKSFILAKEQYDKALALEEAERANRPVQAPPPLAPEPATQSVNPEPETYSQPEIAPEPEPIAPVEQSRAQAQPGLSSIGAFFRQGNPAPTPPRAAPPPPRPVEQAAPAPAPIAKPVYYGRDGLSLEEKMEKIPLLLAELHQSSANSDKADALYKDAMRLVDLSNWVGAIQRLEKVLELDPNHEEAAAKLNEVRTQKEWAAKYEQGEIHYQRKEWYESLAAFKELSEMAGNYQNVEGRITEVRVKITDYETIMRFYTEIISFYETNQWAKVLELAKLILEIDASEKRAADYQREAHYYVLKEIYDIGRSHATKGEWTEAIDYFTQVKEQDTSELFPDIENDIKATRMRMLEEKALADAANRAVGNPATPAPSAPQQPRPVQNAVRPTAPGQPAPAPQPARRPPPPPGVQASRPGQPNQPPRPGVQATASRPASGGTVAARPATPIARNGTSSMPARRPPPPPPRPGVPRSGAAGTVVRSKTAAKRPGQVEKSGMSTTTIMLIVFFVFAAVVLILVIFLLNSNNQATPTGTPKSLLVLLDLQI